MTKIRENQLSEPAGLAQIRTLLATRVRVLADGEAVPEGAEVLTDGDTSAPGDWLPVIPAKLGGAH